MQRLERLDCPGRDSNLNRYVNVLHGETCQDGHRCLVSDEGVAERNSRSVPFVRPYNFGVTVSNKIVVLFFIIRSL